MDVTGTSQPSIAEAYITPGNPIDKTSEEESEAMQKGNSDAGSMVAARERGDMPVPSTHNEEPTPSSLGYGVRSASGDKDDGEPGLPNTEAEQMRAPGEGEVMQAQLQKTGFGEQADLASNLEQKKAEQAHERDIIKQQRNEGVGQGGAAGQTGGPAVVEGR